MKGWSSIWMHYGNWDEYLFSGAEIGDAERMGLGSWAIIETDDSYWGIWVYELFISLTWLLIELPCSNFLKFHKIFLLEEKSVYV